MRDSGAQKLGDPVNIQSIKVKIVALSVVCLVTTVAAVVGYGVFASKQVNEQTSKISIGSGNSKVNSCARL